MKFALVYQYDPTTTSPQESEIPDWMSWDSDAREAGVLVCAEGFHHVDTAVTLQTRDGETRTEKGVHGSGPQVIAGFCVVDVDDLAAAETWAARLPTARYGSVQIRPVVEWEG